MNKLSVTALGAVVVVATLVFVFIAKRADTKSTRVKVDLSIHFENLNAIKQKCGLFPKEYLGDITTWDTCAKEVVAKVTAKIDPWGNPYLYLGDGEHFIIKTTGPYRIATDESGVVLEAIEGTVKKPNESN